jgi:glutamate synthase (NADPH/NADH) small chain
MKGSIGVGCIKRRRLKMQERNEEKTINTKKERTPMPEQPAKKRMKNFNEVTLGYIKEDALAEGF